MKKNTLISIFITILMGFSLLIINSCIDELTTPSNAIARDFDGNNYQTVKIGTQVWMTENLKTTHYRNGDPIPNVTNTTVWSESVNGAYCDWGNDPTNGKIYGHLYNFYTIADSRQLCPKGWHVPTYSEWMTLINYLGGTNAAGIKLREAGITHWTLPGGDNSSGFTALASSWRGGDGLFYYWIGQSAWWWTSTEQIDLNPYSIAIGADNIVYANWDSYHTKAAGNSIRCIKD